MASTSTTSSTAPSTTSTLTPNEVAQLLVTLAEGEAMGPHHVATSAALLATVGLTPAQCGPGVVAMARSMAQARSTQLQHLAQARNARAVACGLPLPLGAVGGCGGANTTWATAAPSPQATKAQVAPARKPYTQVRAQVFGYAVTAVLRFMGANGYTPEEAGVALASYGAGAISDITIRLQLAAGRKGERGPAAPLTPAQAKALRAATL